MTLWNVLFIISFTILSSFVFLLLWKQKDPFLKRISRNVQGKKMEYFLMRWNIVQYAAILVYIALNIGIYLLLGDLYVKVVGAGGLLFILFVIFIVPMFNKKDK